MIHHVHLHSYREMKMEEDPTMYEHHASYTKSVLCLKAKPSVTWEMGPPLSLRLLQGRVASRQTLDLLSSAIFPCSFHPLIAWAVILPTWTCGKWSFIGISPKESKTCSQMWWEKPNSYGEFWEPCGWVTWAALTSMTDIMLPFSPPSWGGVAKTPRLGDTFGLIPTSFWNIGSYSSISEITKQRTILGFFSHSTLTRQVSLGVCVFEGFLMIFSCLTRPTSANLGLPLLDALRAGQTSTKHESWRVTAARCCELYRVSTFCNHCRICSRLLPYAFW